MTCSRSRSEEPTTSQWVWHTSMWRVYWSCGCAKYVTSSIDDPPTERVENADRSCDGSGSGDPFYEAWVEALTNKVRH